MVEVAFEEEGEFAEGFARNLTLAFARAHDQARTQVTGLLIGVSLVAELEQEFAGHLDAALAVMGLLERGERRRADKADELLAAVRYARELDDLRDRIDSAHLSTPLRVGFHGLAEVFFRDDAIYLGGQGEVLEFLVGELDAAGVPMDGFDLMGARAGTVALERVLRKAKRDYADLFRFRFVSLRRFVQRLEHARTIAGVLHTRLGALHTHAAILHRAAMARDLSGEDLLDLDLGGLDLARHRLEGAVWNDGTRWPPELLEYVRERSAEVAPGVFKIGPSPAPADQAVQV